MNNTSTLKTAPITAPFLSGPKVYALFICFLVYTFNYVDRQILIILAEPIKAEFGLKDWQLGFLTGTAFALLYATLGIPIARLADRWHRVNIMAISLSIWSAMTALCAFTGNFVQLAAARIGVGVGEAGGAPPAVSLLSDYFSPKQRSTAMGIFSLGPTIGLLVGFGVGGWLNELYGWRAALLVVGLPGILLAVLIKFTLPEPPRESTGNANDINLPFGKTCRTLFRIRTFRLVNLGAVAAGFTVYGFMTWTPIYLIREFEMTTGEVGTAIGLVAGIAGSIGVFFGGFLADFLSKYSERWQMRVPAITTFLFFPLILMVLNAPSATVAIIWLVPAYAAALAYTGPTWAALQSVSPPHMRAMAAAILLFFVNLLGLGFGPQLIGILSDLNQSLTGSGGLRFAIGLGGSVTLLASLFYYLASLSFKADMAASQATE